MSGHRSLQRLHNIQLLEFTASQIAGILEGEVEGNPEIAVHKLAKIEEGESGSLHFWQIPNILLIYIATEASITIVNKDFVPEQIFPLH